MKINSPKVSACAYICRKTYSRKWSFSICKHMRNADCRKFPLTCFKIVGFSEFIRFDTVFVSSDQILPSLVDTGKTIIVLIDTLALPLQPINRFFNCFNISIKLRRYGPIPTNVATECASGYVKRNIDSYNLTFWIDSKLIRPKLSPKSVAAKMGSVKIPVKVWCFWNVLKIFAKTFSKRKPCLIKIPPKKNANLDCPDTKLWARSCIIILTVMF